MAANGGMSAGVAVPRKRPALSPSLRMTPAPVLGKFRPVVGQCCQRCTPDSLARHRQDAKSEQSANLGFSDILSVNESHTRYRGWLVRRMCCVLFVCARDVYPGRGVARQERLCQSHGVREALASEVKVAKDHVKDQVKGHPLSFFRPIINTCISPFFLRCVGWASMKMFSWLFGSVQVNLDHFRALRAASREGSPLVYVYVRQSPLDNAVLSLALFFNGLRVPYAICPFPVANSFLRMVLQKIGAILLPSSAASEEEAETDALYAPVMTSLLRELLAEGQSLSLGISAESGRGRQWLDAVGRLVRDGDVPDVRLVPVGIAYDGVPKTHVQPGPRLRRLFSRLWKKAEAGSVRIHLAQAFSLREMSTSGRWRMDEWCSLKDLLEPAILKRRLVSASAESGLGQRRTSWPAPPRRPEPNGGESRPSDAVAVHLIFSASCCAAVMSTGLLSALLLYRHRQAGARVSLLCRDVAWLTEELLFRDKDVGFGGSLAQVLHTSLALLAPNLIMAAAPPPSRPDPFILARPTPDATLELERRAQMVTRAFILEAVGACAVSSALHDVGARTETPDGGVRGRAEFDVALSPSELNRRALRLCHLLPAGFRPPCQSPQSFALDAVESLLRCGVLIQKEDHGEIPVDDTRRRKRVSTWMATDQPDDGQSDQEAAPFYKMSRPSQCPDMLLFLVNMLAGRLRTLCWTAAFLERLASPLPEAHFVTELRSHLRKTAQENKRQYESCSPEAATDAVETFVDLGVLTKENGEEGGVFLGLTPVYRVPENQSKLQQFIQQYLPPP
ncbi:glycerol-3-phosphate acyltransferase 2, mitochondrial-like [Stigmatopora nigra]